MGQFQVHNEIMHLRAQHRPWREAALDAHTEVLTLSLLTQHKN